MKDVFVCADNIFSPIGSTTAENFTQCRKNISGIQLHNRQDMSAEPFQAALFPGEIEMPVNGNPAGFTQFETLLIRSVQDALKGCSIQPADNRTVLVLSTTKGNISLLETEPVTEELYQRVSLNTSAKRIADYFGFINKPVIVSNACISGMLAILTGMRLIQSGQFDHAVVTGADVISKFVLSGFQSFQAVSKLPCKPFDADRDGINLGEAAGTVILSGTAGFSNGIRVKAGSVSNDANHISGPSRTGEELYLAISKAMQTAGLSAGDIDFISAHGTATVFNDEMEAKAITLAGLQHKPVNSLKGYYGHTLGAAGLIECIISMEALKHNEIIPTRGFKKMGVLPQVNVCTELQKKQSKNFLKTASGFGGCNAALIFSKAD